MFTKQDFKKANIIRTKLLLLIATEQSIKKHSLNNNVMMLNSKSFDEINKKYQINSFKITMSNKIINGGKNLCMSYSSTMNPRSLFNTSQIKDDDKLKEKLISKKIVSKKLESNLMETRKLNLPNKFEKIIIKAKRKISQNKLHIEFLTPVQKNEENFNPEKLKLIEIQKISISVFKNYNLVKTKTLQRQKTLSVKSKNLKNSEEKERNSFFHSSNVIPKVKNYNLTAKNVRNNEKKKSHNDKNKLLNNIMEIEDDNDSLPNFPSSTKNKKSFKGNKIFFVNNKGIADDGYPVC